MKVNLLKSVVLLTLLTPFTMFAQTNHIKGLLIDKQTKAPLPYANIAIDARFQGTVTNEDGKFIIDLSTVDANSKVSFSYIGYNSVQVLSSSLKDSCIIELTPALVNLKTFEVSSKPLKAKEIIDLIVDNYPTNYPNLSERRKIFFHSYNKTPFTNKDMIKVKRSTFESMDDKLMDEIMNLIPDTLIEYNDVVLNLYSLGKENKAIPISAISLEASNQQELQKKFESKLGLFFGEVETPEEDIYYKWKTGIFSFEIETDSIKNDSANGDSNIKVEMNSVSRKTEFVRNGINSVINNNASIDSDNWEFLTSPGKYKFTKERVTVFNDELVYEISFRPKYRGLFKGVMYVSTSSYAILELNYQYQEGKKDENIQLLGIGHAILNESARVLFEKVENGYALKYINAKHLEYAAIERNFSIIKKQKRWFIDKTLKEIKFDVEVAFNTYTNWEVLVLEKEAITNEDFDKIEEPEKVEYKKQLVFNPNEFNSASVIAPSNELKKYEK
ncbi:MAG: carboxypeptidase-like regulatory domain-containing protein [Salibacteraceae bacterium]